MSKKKNASSASTKVVETGVAINSRVNLKCKNAKQKELVKSIYENDIIFVEGVFGVGKTFVINSVALEMLKEPNNGIDKIMCIVPTVEVGTMHLGSLPGDLSQKLENHCINEMDAFTKILKKSENSNSDLIIEKLIIPSYLCLKVFLPYISYYFRVYYRMTASHGQRDTEVDQVDEPARTETC